MTDSLFNFVENFILVFIVITAFILGFVAGILLVEKMNKDKITKEEQNIIKKYDGLRFTGNYTDPTATEYAQTYDPYGDWVCINVYKMDYNQCVKISTHECAHELFAELCQKDDELCKKVQGMINERTNNNGTK